MEKNDQEPVQNQLRRRKWNWLGHTLRRSAALTYIRELLRSELT